MICFAGNIKLVKISVVFHLQLQFGDLIAFPKCDCTVKSVYKHYAVYVGDKEFADKKKEDNIFERKSKCNWSGNY